MSYFCWKAKAKFLICDHTTLCWQLLVSYLWEFTSDSDLGIWSCRIDEEEEASVTCA